MTAGPDRDNANALKTTPIQLIREPLTKSQKNMTASAGPNRGARTFACRVETPLDVFGAGEVLLCAAPLPQSRKFSTQNKQLTTISLNRHANLQPEIACG